MRTAGADGTVQLHAEKVQIITEISSDAPFALQSAIDPAVHIGGTKLVFPHGFPLFSCGNSKLFLKCVAGQAFRIAGFATRDTAVDLPPRFLVETTTPEDVWGVDTEQQICGRILQRETADGAASLGTTQDKMLQLAGAACGSSGGLSIGVMVQSVEAINAEMTRRGLAEHVTSVRLVEPKPYWELAIGEGGSSSMTFPLDYTGPNSKADDSADSK